jgi:hypothetical protein
MVALTEPLVPGVDEPDCVVAFKAALLLGIQTVE